MTSHGGFLGAYVSERSRRGGSLPLSLSWDATQLFLSKLTTATSFIFKNTCYATAAKIYSTSTVAVSMWHWHEHEYLVWCFRSHCLGFNWWKIITKFNCTSKTLYSVSAVVLAESHCAIKKIYVTSIIKMGHTCQMKPSLCYKKGQCPSLRVHPEVFFFFYLDNKVFRVCFNFFSLVLIFCGGEKSVRKTDIY